MKFLETDVLVIGGGGAGAMATLHAHNQGAKALMVVKGKFGRTGGTTCAMGAATAVGPWHEPEDSQQVHFEDTIRGGSYLNEQRLVHILVEDSPKRVLELERLGAFWERTEDGDRYLLRIDGGHSYPRSVYLEDRPGREMLRAMGGEILRRNVPVIEDVMILRLLLDDGQVAGAVGVNLFTAEMIGFKAKTAILATGGAGNVYPVTTNPADVTGDGYVLALRAGAELVDMEFVQFYPLGLIFPESLKGMLAGTFYYSKLLNARHERLMKYYDPARLEMSTRDIIARAIYSEIQKGNGTPRGGVLCDMTYNPHGFMKKQLPALYDFYLKIGIDVEKQMVEVAPTCHFFMGGVRVNEEWRSTVPTLFAAGEAAGGVQGANRLSQNSLADIMVSGGRAGDAAGREVKNRSFGKINDEEIKEEQRRVEELFSRKREDGIGPRRVKKRLNKVMWDSMGLIRSQAGLEEALAEFQRMEEEDLPRITLASSSRRYNRELIETLEVSNLLMVARAIATPALCRNESRGAHFREDFPKGDNRNWLKHLRVSKKNGTLQLTEGPVDLSEIKPPQEE